MAVNRFFLVSFKIRPLETTFKVIIYKVHTTFYHSSGLTRNQMFNGSIYYVLFADTALVPWDSSADKKDQQRQDRRPTLSHVARQLFQLG